MAPLNTMLNNCCNLDIPDLTEPIQHGDMPGDRILIENIHIKKSQTVFSRLLSAVQQLPKGPRKLVISVFGGSGVGKSEVASLLGYYFQQNGLCTYILSGDNYPFRIPIYYDAERLRIFRCAGVRALPCRNRMDYGAWETLENLQRCGNDADPAVTVEYPWLKDYQCAGRKALSQYLGKEPEIDYSDLNHIINEFKNNAKTVPMKRMGRTETELWYEDADISKTEILIIEWTHGGNERLCGIDLSVFLYSSPEETLEHRRKRSRDNNPDSPFTLMVLELEQELLLSQIGAADIVVRRNGELMDPEEIAILQSTVLNAQEEKSNE